MRSKAANPSVVYSPLREFEREFVRPVQGRTLIVGSQVYGTKEDRRQRYSNAVGIDMLDGPGVDRVLDLELPLPDDLGTFAHVECMSVLEHSRRPWLLAANLQMLLEPFGSIFVTVPFCWRVHAYPDDFWRFTMAGVAELFPLVTWQAMRFGNYELTADPQLKAIKNGGLPYFPRTETFAFGTRR